jgi:phosphoribosyl 1,2-cyclic phosphate phosphodiesterase
MRFEFLGTGTSAGIPMIGCSCAVCTSDDPRDKRLRTAGVLRFSDAQGHDRVILLDAGPDLRVQALRSNLQRCDAILFTHNHVDHIFGLDEVRRFNAVMKAPIDIYADDHTMDSLERVYKHIFERDKNVNDSFVATLIPHRVSDRDIRDARPLRLFGLRATPIPLLHGRLPVLGWKIEERDEETERRRDEVGTDSSTSSLRLSVSPSLLPLSYCTDISAVPTESWKRLAGTQTLILDCLRERKHPTHLTLDEAVHIASEVNAARTYFVHMAHELPHQETQDRLPEGMFLAYDGLVLDDSAG